MKFKVLIALFLFSFASLAIAGVCDGLYPGKAITFSNGAGDSWTVRRFPPSTIKALVLGVDERSTMVTIKITNTGGEDPREGSCLMLKKAINY